MLDGKSDRTRRIAIGLVAMMVGALIAFGAEKADASTPLRPSPNLLRWQASCPPGHRVELRFGQASLFVEPRWLSNLQMPRADAVSDNCPTTPQSVYMATINTSRVPSHQGLPPVLHFTQSEPNTRAQLNLIGTAPNTRRVLADKGEIDDLTSFPQTIGDHRYRRRSYRLRPPVSQAGTATPPALATCFDAAQSSGGTERQCLVRYLYNHDLVIGYLVGATLQRDPEERVVPSDEAALEPDGVLALDMRVRAFIEELRQKP